MLCTLEYRYASDGVSKVGDVTYHRITVTELLELEGIFKGYLVQCSCNEQGHPQLELRAPSSLTVSIHRDGASTTSQQKKSVLSLLLNMHLMLAKEQNLCARVVQFILGTATACPFQRTPAVTKAASCLEEQHCATSPIETHRSSWSEIVILIQNTLLAVVSLGCLVNISCCKQHAESSWILMLEPRWELVMRIQTRWLTQARPSA